MKKGLLFVMFSAAILICGYFSFTQNTGTLFQEYGKLWRFRILHPEVLPTPKLIQATVAGNSKSYSDAMWISLIQYIGDNIFNNSYKDFLNPIVENIVELHPHFTEPYNLALLLSPNINPEKEDSDERRRITERAFAISEKGIANNCDIDKMSRIEKMEFSRKLWDDSTLRNPCNDSMLAYNLAITASELGEFQKAKSYFKLASMQDESPEASKFLGPLMDAKGGEFRATGERFLLLALEAYDEAPYSCRGNALKMLESLKSQDLKSFISGLKTIEEQTHKPVDADNPIATSENTCYAYIMRSMKQMYLAYIQEITKDYPEITKGSELIEKGFLEKIPSTKEYDGWTVIKKDALWRYSQF